MYLKLELARRNFGALNKCYSSGKFKRLKIAANCF